MGIPEKPNLSQHEEKGNPSKIPHLVVDLATKSVLKLHPNASLSKLSFEENQFFCDFDIPEETLSSKELEELSSVMEKNAVLNGLSQITSSNFALLEVSGVHSEENPEKMIQRLHGAFFNNKKEKQDYLDFLKQAKERNHITLGKELDLFVLAEHAPGMPYWLTKGLKIKHTLLEFWREEHEARGYQEVQTPLLNKTTLFEQSGHMDHYRENMFISNTSQGEWAAKPMNCPNAMYIFQLKERSYKDLPLRFSDSDTLHRLEKSGVLNGLLRVQEFSQDDAHIFLGQEQIEPEINDILQIVDRFYSVFGLDYSFRLSTRGSDYMGDVKTWNLAESILNNLLENQKKTFSIDSGGAAFYGPKIDIMMKDSLKREWQMGTIQLDFQLPGRFNLSYMDENGAGKTPIVIHRVVYGSLERFIGIITEHFAGAFPTWLAPIQVSILPITENDRDYASQIYSQLKKDGRRVDLLDDTSERLNRRVLKSTKMKVPYTIVVGGREKENNSVSVRPLLGEKANSVVMPFNNFKERLGKEIEQKSLKIQIVD